MKPSNVLITRQRQRDFVHLVDFGIVRVLDPGSAPSLTATGQAIGTLDYMAPELFQGRRVDRRADVYALGCLLYEALSGRPPFRGTGAELMYHHINTSPPPISELAAVTPAMDRVLSAALAKDPERRPESAGDLAELAIDSVSRTTPGSSPDPSAAGSTRRARPVGDRGTRRGGAEESSQKTREPRQKRPPPRPAAPRGAYSRVRQYGPMVITVLITVIGLGLLAFLGVTGVVGR